MSKIYYCPRCGHVEEARWAAICSCKHKLLSQQKLIPSDLEYEDFDLTQPMTAFGATREMYDAISAKYVNIPSNKKLNKEAHKKQLEKVYAIFDRGGAGKFPTFICPKCGSNNTTVVADQQGFSAGKAVAGAAVGVVAAGPVGLAGAAAGFSGAKNRRVICHTCGHVWTSGR